MRSRVPLTSRATLLPIGRERTIVHSLPLPRQLSRASCRLGTPVSVVLPGFYRASIGLAPWPPYENAQKTCVNSPRPATPDREWQCWATLAEIRALATSGRKIEAIKRLRDATDLDLARAKDIVDALARMRQD